MLSSNRGYKFSILLLVGLLLVAPILGIGSVTALEDTEYYSSDVTFTPSDDSLTTIEVAPQDSGNTFETGRTQAEESFTIDTDEIIEPTTTNVPRPEQTVEIRNPSTGNVLDKFTVTEASITASLDPASLDKANTTETDLTVDADYNNSYDVILDSPSISASELAGTSDAITVNSSSQAEISDVNGSQTLTLDVSSISTGDYSVNAQVKDTPTELSDPLTLSISSTPSEQLTVQAVQNVEGGTEPIENADITVDGETKSADSNGEVTFSKTINREYTITADSLGFSEATQTVQFDGASTEVITLSRDAGESDVLLNEDESAFVWQGQTIGAEGEALANLSSEENVRLETSEGDFIQEYEVVNGNQVLIDTEDIQTGNYRIRAGGDTFATFELAAQTLSVNFEDEAVLNEGVNTTVESTVESNRNRFTATVESQNLSNEELVSIIEGAQLETDSEDNEEVVLQLQNEESIEYNFNEIPSGGYTFTYDVQDTTASTQEAITVSGLEDNQPSFQNRMYNGIYTGTTDIGINMPSGVQEMEVEVSDKVGSYQATVVIENQNPSNAANVTLEMNTLFAGNNYEGQTFSVEAESPDGSEDSEDSGDSEDSEDDEEENQPSVSIVNVTESETPDDRPLDPTNYLLTLRTSDGDEADLAGLSLSELDVSAETYIVPQTVTLQDLRTEEVEQELENGETVTVTQEIEDPFYTIEDVVTQGNTISDQDRVYVVFENTGLEQFLNREEFGGSIDSLDTGDFNEGSEVAEQLGIYLTVTGENPRPNRPDVDLDITELDYISSEDKNYFAFGFDPAQLEDVDSVSSPYNVTLTVDERNPAIREEPIPGTDIPVSEPQTSETEIVIEEADTSFEYDTYFVEPEQELTAQADTNLAQNTELTMVARNDSLGFPYLEEKDLTVPEEQTVSGTFTLGEPDIGEEFTLFFEELGRSGGPSATIEVVEDAEAAREEARGGDEEDEEAEEPSGPTTRDVSVELLDSQTGQRVQGFVSYNDQTVSTQRGTLILPVEQDLELTTRTQGEYVDVTVTEFIETDQNTVSIELEPSNPEFISTVSVVDESGSVVNGANVSITEDTTNPRTFSGTTGLNGNYQFDTSASTYIITASAEGYEVAEQTVELSEENSDVTVTLTEEQMEQEPDDDEEEAPGQPGFGPLTVLVALVALVISVHRENRQNE